MITVTKLYEILDKESPEALLYKIAERLTEAMNDWPIKVDSVEDFLKKVEEYLGSQIDSESLNRALKNLKPQTDAWVIESLSNLKMILEIGGNKPIDVILKGLE